MQLVPITIQAIISIPARNEVYSIHLYVKSFVSNLQQGDSILFVFLFSQPRKSKYLVITKLLLIQWKTKQK